MLSYVYDVILVTETVIMSCHVSCRRQVKANEARLARNRGNTRSQLIPNPHSLCPPDYRIIEFPKPSLDYHNDVLARGSSEHGMNWDAQTQTPLL